MIKLFIFIALVLLIIVVPYYGGLLYYWVFKKISGYSTVKGSKMNIWLNGGYALIMLTFILFFLYLIFQFVLVIIIPFLAYLESFFI
jgi:hypothetical protein